TTIRMARSAKEQALVTIVIARKHCQESEESEEDEMKGKGKTSVKGRLSFKQAAFQREEKEERTAQQSRSSHLESLLMHD
ncbi:hypothetical protein K0M31_010012, partial [Melipona bicolor]